MRLDLYTIYKQTQKSITELTFRAKNALKLYKTNYVIFLKIGYDLDIKGFLGPISKA